MATSAVPKIELPVETLSSHRAASGLSSHIPALDGVRGVAVLLVLSYHFGVGATYSGLNYLVVKVVTRFGWTGVDLFFVLSGFLITGILYDERRSPHYLRNFYARRVLRIFPLYYLGLLFVVGLIAVWPPLAQAKTEGFIWPILYLSNVAIARDGWLAIPELLSHYWSLSVEEHFYLVWPFIVYFGTRTELMRFIIGLVALTFGLRVLLVLTHTNPTAVFVLTPTRLDALAIGGFFSLAVRGPAGLDGLLRPTALLTGVSLFGILALTARAGAFEGDDPWVQTLGFSLVGLACGGAIIVGLTWRPLRNLLENGVLRWLGRYSYGLYVWHYPVYFVFYENYALMDRFGVKGGLGSVVYLCAALAFTTLIAVAGYHLYEKPFLKLKSKFPRATRNGRSPEASEASSVGRA